MISNFVNFLAIRISFRFIGLSLSRLLLRFLICTIFAILLSFNRSRCSFHSRLLPGVHQDHIHHTSIEYQSFFYGPAVLLSLLIIISSFWCFPSCTFLMEDKTRIVLMCLPFINGNGFESYFFKLIIQTMICTSFSDYIRYGYSVYKEHLNNWHWTYIKMT